jgi:hypothetical protein
VSLSEVGAPPASTPPSLTPLPASLGDEHPRDPQRAMPIVFRLECYQIKVPIGTVSQNDAIWKRINEQCVDVPTYDLLHRNGIRVGTAPYSEWPRINEALRQQPVAATNVATVGDEMKNIPLEMKRDVPFQTIFCFDSQNTPCGRTFDRSDNFLNLSFQRVPRKPGHVRLAIAPVVRSERKRLEYTVLNDELEFAMKRPETFYLNLVVDVPVGQFLILAPSNEATWPSSVGHAFLINEGAAEQFEQVIVIAAQPLIDVPRKK